VSLESPRPRRTQIDIVMKILAVASEGDGATKTALVYGSNLNFTLVQRYIALLRRKGFLETAPDRYGSTMYRTTKVGSEALGALRRAIGLVFGEATTTPTQ
jgi:predicted transcriptional regulator